MLLRPLLSLYFSSLDPKMFFPTNSPLAAGQEMCTFCFVNHADCAPAGTDKRINLWMLSQKLTNGRDSVARVAPQSRQKEAAYFQTANAKSLHNIAGKAKTRGYVGRINAPVNKDNW